MNSKPWYRSRTVWLGILMVLCSVAEYILGLPVGTSVTQAISGVLTIIIRTITNQPISK